MMVKTRIMKIIIMMIGVIIIHMIIIIRMYST